MMLMATRSLRVPFAAGVQRRTLCSSTSGRVDGAVVGLVDGAIGQGNERLSSLGQTFNDLSGGQILSRFAPFLKPRDDPEPEEGKEDVVAKDGEAGKKEEKAKKEKKGLFKKMTVYDLQGQVGGQETTIPGRISLVNLLRSEELKSQPFSDREISRLGASAAVKQLVASGALRIEVDELLDAKGLLSLLSSPLLWIFWTDRV